MRVETGVDHQYSKSDSTPQPSNLGGTLYNEILAYLQLYLVRVFVP